MKILMGLAVLVALLYIGNEFYQKHQSENKFRAELKAIKVTPYMIESNQGAPLTQRIDNQYPHITYITIFDEDATLVSDIEEKVKYNANLQLCALVNDVDLKFNRDKRKAAIAVIEQDDVRISLRVKHGDKMLFKTSKHLKDCGVMTQLKSLY